MLRVMIYVTLLTAGETSTNSISDIVMDELEIVSLVIQSCTALINTLIAGKLGLTLSRDI